MKHIPLILLFILCLIGCNASKGIVTKKSKAVKVSEATSPDATSAKRPKSEALADSIISYAKQFDGVKYKYGGTTKKGMDCSGLVTTAFKSEHISLPRTTGDLAHTGEWVDINEVQKGDLLFFGTKKNHRKINHVGLVIDVRPGYVEFIHATTHAGVIISNLAERYWYVAFVQARRVL